MKCYPQSDRLRSFTISFVSRFLAVSILSSFAVALLPIVSTSAEQSSMPCCAGKSAEHCDAGLMAPKPRPVITEPMCGLPSGLPSGVPSGVPSPPPANTATVATTPLAIEAVAVEQECHMDCGACATVTSRNKRQKTLVQARLMLVAPATGSRHFDNSTVIRLSNENWTQLNPRGPPAGC